MINVWDQFFHGRVGNQACRLGGLIRIGFGLILLWDRFILGLDLDEFWSPTHGKLPFHAGRDNANIVRSMWTLLGIFPESDVWMWALYWIGMIQASLLVLGIYPRVQAACLLVNIQSFQNHNSMFWDHQDVLFRLWCIFLLFLPLNRVTIFDLLYNNNHNNNNNNNNNEKRARGETSWPLWPFRLFQIELTLAYMGLSLNKLENDYWRKGEAMYWVKEDIYFAGGGWLALPDFISNRMLFWQLVSWLTMGLELTCWVTMWIPGLKRYTAYTMIAFYLCLDLTTNFHCLPWLAILGWAATLFEKQESAPKTTNHLPAHHSDNFRKLQRRIRSQSESMQTLTSYEIKLWSNLFLIALLGLLCLNAFPVKPFERFVLSSETTTLRDLHSWFNAKIEPTLCFFGLWQLEWNLYGGKTLSDYYRVKLSAILYRDTGVADDPTDSIQPELWNGLDMDQQTTGWERKRHARQMIYWVNMANTVSSSAWISLGENLSGQQEIENGAKHKMISRQRKEGTVVGLELKAHWTGVGYPLADPWTWDEPAQDERNVLEEWTSIFKIRYCTDVVPWLESSLDSEGFCSDCIADPKYVGRYCRDTCEVCVNHFAEYGHTYLDSALSEHIDADYCTGKESDNDNDNWDEEECPSYIYYRDFDPSVPHDQSESVALRKKYMAAMKSDLVDRPRPKGGETVEGQEIVGDSSRVDPVSSVNVKGNQTSSLDSAPTRRTVLRSA